MVHRKLDLPNVYIVLRCLKRMIMFAPINQGILHVITKKINGIETHEQNDIYQAIKLLCIKREENEGVRYTTKRGKRGISVISIRRINGNKLLFHVRLLY